MDKNKIMTTFLVLALFEIIAGAVRAAVLSATVPADEARQEWKVEGRDWMTLVVLEGTQPRLRVDGLAVERGWGEVPSDQRPRVANGQRLFAERRWGIKRPSWDKTPEKKHDLRFTYSKVGTNTIRIAIEATPDFGTQYAHPDRGVGLGLLLTRQPCLEGVACRIESADGKAFELPYPWPAGDYPEVKSMTARSADGDLARFTFEPPLFVLSDHDGISMFASPKSQTPAGGVMTQTIDMALARPIAFAPESRPDLARRAAAGELGFTRLLVVRRPALRSSHIYDYHLCRSSGGGLFVADLRLGPDAPPEKLLDSEQGLILDAVLSFAGNEIVFSWWRPSSGKYMQIYRMKVDGSGLTQLTHGEYDNFNPVWLPDGGIAFLSARLPQVAYCWRSSSGILHRMDRDGKNVVRLSAGHLNEFTPSVLNDGRIIYGRWEYVDRNEIEIQSLWAIRPDGTGLSGYFGNRTLRPATFMEANPIPGAPSVLCLMAGHGGSPRGAVGVVDPRYGANAQKGIRNLTPEIKVGTADGKGPGDIVVSGAYENPFPLDAKHFVVSRGGSIVLRDYDGMEQVVWLTPRDGMGYYNPRPLRVVEAPPVLARAQDRFRDADEAGSEATIVMQDVYVGLEGHVQRGEIVAIRVVQELAKQTAFDIETRAFGFMFPVVSARATHAPKKVWGDAPVAADGSANFKVPAGVPLHFLALDKEGRAVQRMRSFTHLMPAETQGCVGCHADRNYVSPARSSAFVASAREAPVALAEPEWGRAGFSYAHIVQPVLDRHCVACHNPRQQSAGLDLTGDFTDLFNVSYDNLIRKGTTLENPQIPGHRPTANFPPKRAFKGTSGPPSKHVRWVPTLYTVLQIAPRQWCSPASPLTGLLMKGHPDAAGKPRVTMSDAERRRIFAWMDLNVPYYGTSASRRPDLDGCRRLWPEQLEKTLNEVSARRCVSCHADDKGQPAAPRTFYLRLTRPELNDFLLAPLARAAGGTEACGRAVFASTEDPDYRAILETFRPIAKLIAAEPREDMEPSRLQCPPCESPDSASRDAIPMSGKGHAKETAPEFTK